MKKIKAELNETAEFTRGFLDEFKDFILRGNVVELAVGLTVGAAFTAFVSSLVNNILLPLIGLILSGESFADLYIALDGEEYESLEVAKAASAPLLKYGQFISDTIDLLIIGLVVFLIVRVLVKKREEERVST